MTPFKIGSIYRDTDGNLVRLYRHPSDSALAQCALIEEGKETEFDGECRLSDGRDPTRLCFDLVEGELNAQGEPIAPTFYCAAETIKPIVLINRPGMKFVAKVPDGLSVTTADLHMVARDDKRAPLQSQSAGRYDPFKGFVVKRDTATPDHAYSHPLTRVADAGAQVSAQHGSAHILPNA